MRTMKRCRHALLVFLIFLIFARECARGAACMENEEMQADLAKARVDAGGALDPGNSS